MNIFEKCGFLPADILLPNKNIDMNKWAVIACDQYTSNLEYWKKVEETVKDTYSTYNLILPEIYLNSDNVDERIKKINIAMDKYMSDGILQNIYSSYIYVERTLPDNTVRHGIIGMLDLDLYDFSPNSKSRVRATEGTIVERIPPRLKVRENASLELPHIMLLIDDRTKSIIESLAEKKANFKKIYDFELMQNAGRIAGYIIDNETAEKIADKLDTLSSKEIMMQKYNRCDNVLQYAVGDGNHSLATAKSHYDKTKNPLSRYALCELVDLHDDSLIFEAIHRTVFDVDTNDLIASLFEEYPNAEKCKTPKINAQNIQIITRNENFYFVLEKPKYKLEVATLQNFLDKFKKGRIDYIHGAEEATKLAGNENTISFILPAMKKEDLFDAVIADGALPRKTFSMGEAETKRFYVESRKIK